MDWESEQELDEALAQWLARFLVAEFEREERLYNAARETCHSLGMPWTDPRTGRTYPPPES